MYKRGQSYEDYAREIEEFAQNLPAIGEWFVELTNIWEEILVVRRKTCSALEQLGEVELAKDLDLAIEAFNRSFYDVITEEEEQTPVENLDAAVDNPQAVEGSLEVDSNKENPK